MRFVLFSDLHLDRPFSWAGPEIGRKLRAAIRNTLERVCNLAREEQADALVCAGDLYEQNCFTPDTAAFLQRSFSELAPMDVFIAPGNHDWYSPRSLYAQTPWSENVHVFTEDRFVAMELSDSITLWGVAHKRPESAVNFLRGFRAPSETWNLALFHGSELSYLAAQAAQNHDKVAHAPFRESDIAEAGLSHAFVGHYHLPRDADLYTYPGSPQPLAFGEGNGGAVIIDFVDGRVVSRKRTQVTSIPFQDVSLDVTGATDVAEVRRKATTLLDDAKGVARLTLCGHLRSGIDLNLIDLTDISTQALAIVVRRGDLREDYDLAVIAREPTIRGQFVTDVQASDLSEDEKRRVITVGLKALAGRRDLEPL